MSETNEPKKNPFENKAKTPYQKAKEEFEARQKRRKVSGTVIRLVITLIFAALYFYVALPALNPQSGDLYAFILLTLAVYVGMTVLSAGLSPKATPAEIGAQIKRTCKPALASGTLSWSTLRTSTSKPSISMKPSSYVVSIGPAWLLSL